MITERIEKRQHEKEELQAQLAVEMAKQVTLTAPQVRAYLYSLRQGDKNDENIKRGIINIFLRAVYLYDDRFTLILNGSDTPITIDDILLDEIEEGLEGDLTNCEGCSSLVADAPPKPGALQLQGSGLFPLLKWIAMSKFFAFMDFYRDEIRHEESYRCNQGRGSFGERMTHIHAALSVWISTLTSSSGIPPARKLTLAAKAS